MIHYIIAIVGPSGAGKTTISFAMRKAGIPDVVSYTTRPMREGEKPNREHIFISEAHAKASLACVEPVAYTEFGGYRYFTFPQQFEQSDMTTYVIDEKGLVMLKEKVKEMSTPEHQFAVFAVYISREAEVISSDIDKERIERDNERIHLNPDTYQVYVQNDASSAMILELWAESFAYALRSSLGHCTLRRASLHTSDYSVLSILDSLIQPPSPINE